MTTKSERLTVLSDAEQEALYGLPDFDDAQRLEYLALTETELALASSRPGLHAQVYCILQIGYFKAKHAFFRFDWSEVEHDCAFVLSRYFHGESFEHKPISKHEHYTQREWIADLFGYRPWAVRNQTELPLAFVAPGASAPRRGNHRGVAVASAAPTAQTPTLARIGLDTFHPTSPPPPPSPSRLDTTASITNDSTSSTIAATQIRLPNGLVSSPSVWSTLVAIPMEVLLNAVPAATPVMTAYPHADMYATPSAMGSIVPLTAMASAIGPTDRRAPTSMLSPPSITSTHNAKSPTRMKASLSGTKPAPSGPKSMPTTISPTSGASTSAPNLPPSASAPKVSASRARSTRYASIL